METQDIGQAYIIANVFFPDKTGENWTDGSCNHNLYQAHRVLQLRHVTPVEL